MSNLLNNRYFWPGLGLLLVIVVPAIADNPFLTHLGVRAGIYAIVAMGFTLFAGYTGQISLGHAAYFGLAAYLSGLMVKAGVTYILAAASATAIVGAFGACVGLFVLRTSGHYLALASIAVAVIVQAAIKNSSITGGPSGLTSIPSPSFMGSTINNDLLYYYYVLVWMIAGIIILQRIVDSRTGDALRAIANNELAAQSLGIPVFRYKVLSFAISTLFAAFAGTLFVHYDGFIDPDRLSLHVSLIFLIMTFIGGVGSIYGAVIGAFALTILEEYTQDFGQYNMLVYGLLLAFVIVFLPKGLIELPNKIKKIVGK